MKRMNMKDHMELVKSLKEQPDIKCKKRTVTEKKVNK